MNIMRVYSRSIYLIICILYTSTLGIKAENCNCKHTINNNELNVDGSQLNVLPGDTICIQSGFRKILRLINFHGDSLNYIVFKNCGGDVIVENEDHYYGIVISNCSYFRFTGSGDKNSNYGIKILKTPKGANGLSVDGLSTDYEIDHIEIAKTGFAGIVSLTQPSCDKLNNRDNFVQKNTIIHDNYIHDTFGEGIYIGHSYYNGFSTDCNNLSEILYPHSIEGLRVYNNLVENSGWDGIQVSCASSDCEIFNNKIINYGLAKEESQNSGIQIGAGTTGKCFNNSIFGGSGSGIVVFGLGNNNLYNNIIVNSGNSTSDNLDKKAYGIFCDDRSTILGRSFNFINNTIINPKTDGIRIYSKLSNNNNIINNLIIKPGSYGQYKSVEQSYIYLNNEVKAIVTNNYFTQNLSPFIDLNSNSNIYNFTLTLPVINKGRDVHEFGIYHDFNNDIRNKDNSCDIGAFEFDTVKVKTDSKSNYKIYPNPSSGIFMVYNNTEKMINRILIKTINGKKIYEENYINSNGGLINLTEKLKNGVYLIDIDTNTERKTEKIIIN